MPSDSQEYNPVQNPENREDNLGADAEFYEDNGDSPERDGDNESDDYLGEEGEYEALREMVEFIARTLASKPDEVQVTEVQKNQQVIFQLRVAEEDKGKVIGKNGRVAEAVRAILKAASVKLQTRALLEIK